MVGQPPQQGEAGRPKTLLDLDDDALARCFGFLGIRDVANLARSCKTLCRVAYSDVVWSHLYGGQWPCHSVSYGALGAREQYLARHTALRQLKFVDPLQKYFDTLCSIHTSHILLDRDIILVAKGSSIKSFRYSPIYPDDFVKTLKGHGARITCMRLFPVREISLFRNAMQHEDNVIVTSSSDWTIRLWWKERSQRCFKGHNGPVTTLADTLLGDSGSKVLASGGEDCTVRLWSVNASGKQHPLILTYHGHEKPLSFLSVAGHKSSLLVSISKDSKVRVWDTSASSSSLSSCVGMTSACRHPVAMKCHDTLCYVAAGDLVTAIDLRTMQKAFTAAVHGPKIYSFEMLPSKWLICSGGQDKALLWDIRKNNPEPLAELELNHNKVKLLHMDPYKVVAAGPLDPKANVWDTRTGFLMNSLDCKTQENTGPAAMAVDGCRIVTSGVHLNPGWVYYRDYSNCSLPVSPAGIESGSKFWAFPIESSTS